MMYRENKSQEIQTIYKDIYIINEFEIRLERLGHVNRMNLNKFTKIVFNNRPNYKRPKGRPRLR